MPYDQAIQPVAVSEEIEDQKVEWFQLYLVCQEDEGFIGTFPEWLQEQVEEGALTEELRNALLDIKPEAGDFEPSVEPDFSDEPEDIEAMDPEDESLVAASIACVVEAGLPFTRLGVGDTRVEGAELLLAALEASGVDNARIEVEGGHEIPVLDNSALPWCIEVQVAGLRPAPVNLDKGAGEPAPDAAADDEDEDHKVVQKNVFTPSKAVGVHDDMGWISFFPGPFTRLTCGVDHTMLAPIIGSQWYTWRAEETYFRYNVAPARAYVESVDELFAMRNAGFVKAGAENLFLIAAGDRWWDPSMVRMVYDEPARFKVSQLLGNLSLMAVAGSQGLPVGHITAYNASPTLQLTFVQQLMQAMEEADVTSLNDVVSKQEDWVQDKYVSSTRTSTSVGPEGLLAQQDAEIAEEGEEDEQDDDDDDDDEGGMFLYFGLMEFLQVGQYLVADQCDNPINQLLTWAAYVHVAFQPLIVNLFFLYGQRNPHPEVGSFVLKLCVASAVLALTRTPLLPITKLGDLLHTKYPDIPPSHTLGKQCHYMEAFCGPRTCSFKGGAWGHISWELPLAPATYFVPGAFNHAFLFFVPTLIAGDMIKRLLMLATIVIGPLHSMAFASADMTTYPFEWATIWCFFAAVQSFWAVVAEVFVWTRGWESASAGEMAMVGKWRTPGQEEEPRQVKEPLLQGKCTTTVTVSADASQL
eukprot:gene13610-13735_t